MKGLNAKPFPDSQSMRKRIDGSFHGLMQTPRGRNQGFTKVKIFVRQDQHLRNWSTANPQKHTVACSRSRERAGFRSRAKASDALFSRLRRDRAAINREPRPAQIPHTRSTRPGPTLPAGGMCSIGTTEGGVAPRQPVHLAKRRSNVTEPWVERETGCQYR